METTKKIRYGVPQAVGSRGNAGIVSEHDRKLLSLDYIGEHDGRHVFRFPDQPLRTLTGDYEDLQEWRQVRARHAMAIISGNKAVAPIIDADMQNAYIFGRQRV